eukprot:357033-Chlamydomonas_euryale.AAC.7
MPPTRQGDVSSRGRVKRDGEGQWHSDFLPRGKPPAATTSHHSAHRWQQSPGWGSSRRWKLTLTVGGCAEGMGCGPGAGWRVTCVRQGCERKATTDYKEQICTPARVLAGQAPGLQG